jgi:hypothetical protein
MFDLDRYLRDSVCSFCGVILIARPQVLFGGPQENPSEEVITSGQRMISVMLGRLCPSRRNCTHRFHRAALIGVLGGTGSCESSSRPPSQSPLVYPPVLTDTLLRAIGKRAHALHVLSFFASQCVLISTIGCVPRLCLLHF